LIVGDAIHNLWSALDHWHYEAIWRDCGVRHAHLLFPKGKDAASYNGQCGATKEASAAMKKLLESLEVFPGGMGEAIYIVNCLDRADKHSMLTPIVHAPSLDELVLVGDGGKVRPVISALYGRTFTFREGETFTINGAPKGITLEFKNDAKISPHILFGNVEFVEGKPILPTIRQLRDAVANTLKIVEASFT
jgi:hypothetical protein